MAPEASRNVRGKAMKTFNLCLLGVGNVGCALLDLLFKKQEELRAEFGVEWRITGVASRSLGWAVAPRPEGFSNEELLFVALTGPARRASLAPEDIKAWLTAARCDVLFEMTSLEPLTGEPAVSHARAGLEYGAHVVTANKGPVVHAYRELSELARSRGRRFMFEAAVAEFPVFSLFRETMPAARLLSFGGILNSTTNIILDEIAAGRTFDEGIIRAQHLGITETDPTYDVDGWDSAVKACALANVLMDAGLKIEEVGREGIRGLKDEDVRAAHAEGRPFRLVARGRRDEWGGIKASVRPERVSPRGPFAVVSGTTLAIHYELDVLPGLTVVAHEPNLTSTAYGLLADFLNAVRKDL